MLPAARLLDPHVCPMHGGGVIGPLGCFRVLIGNLPAARMGDTALCLGLPVNAILRGYPKLLIGGRPAARMTDNTAHGGLITMGCFRVLIGPTGGAASGKSETKQTSPKAFRWQERLDLIKAGRELAQSLPEGEARDELLAAADRLERNNTAVEKAKLAQHVYDPSKPAPEGWIDISNDREALKAYGLTPEKLRLSGDSDFRAAVYVPDPDVFGTDMKPSVVFRGTQSAEDWKNNFAQGLNMESPYYRQAVAIGNAVGDSGMDVDFVGHSLGGGMTSAAATAAGLPGYTFNASGLHPETVGRYGGTNTTPSPENIQAYRVEDEMLTGLQEQGWKGTLGAAALGFVFGGPLGAAIAAAAKIGLSAAMPNAIGTPHTLPGSGNPYSRHGVDQAIDGIETQKTEDKAKLQGALNSMS